MASPSLKASAALLVGLLVALGAIGFVYEQERERHELRARAELITGGSVERGETAFTTYGCGGCHAIKGQPKATGMVGPPLDGIALRAVIGGRLANKPDNLERWIRDPQGVSPGTAMPNLGVTPRDATDLAAFLYSRND